MMYVVKCLTADNKADNIRIEDTRLHETLERLISEGYKNFNVQAWTIEDEIAAFDWAGAQAMLDADDVDDDIVGATVAEMAAEDKAFVAAFYDKAIKEAFAKTRFNEHGLYIRATLAPICVESQIELALYDINRIIQEIGNHRDNHEAVIALPNGQQVTFKKFTGSRENGYQIGLVYMQVDNGTERKVRSYRTTINWLEQMKRMPISALAQMNF